MTWTRFVTLVAGAALGGVLGLSVLVLHQHARIAALEAKIDMLSPIAAFFAPGPEETTAERRARMKRDVDRTTGDLEWLLKASQAPPRR